MPTLRLSILVGIAHVIDRFSIMIKIRNAHPTILVGYWWALLRLSRLVGIAHFIDRCSIMVLIRNAHPTIVYIGGHCPCH
ncbi:MAG: hypothetical protein F6J90_15890 [Moorea sp. SIOASIH]|nr:hypothetical protein [Moorena sp. SIOASIH]